MLITVTGGTGRTGHHVVTGLLVTGLLAAGHSVRGHSVRGHAVRGLVRSQAKGR